MTFDAGCAAFDHAREILLGRLAWLDRPPGLIVDAGCGTGRGTAVLAERFAHAQVLGVDVSAAMLATAAERRMSAALACCDIQSLPLADHSVDLLVANLVLPWCDPHALFSEFARVLAANGMLLVSTTGPATLQEVRRAWRNIDDDVHVHASLDMQTLGDILVQSGLREPVLDTDRVIVSYSAPARLHEELRAVGAVNAARGRRSGLTGPGRFRRYERTLQAEAAAAEGIDITLELIFAQAWGPPVRAAGPPPEPAFHGIPLRRE
jgi:malonyl-CoA O-methyltransferase